MFLTGIGGTAYNLAGCTLSMQVRKSYYPSTLISSYSCYIPSGRTLVSPPDGFIGGLTATATGGTIYISVGATYTSLLSSEQTAKYDIQLVNSNDNNNVTTLLRGSIEVIPEVTKL
jgi:hypothetical protein